MKVLYADPLSHDQCFTITSKSFGDSPGLSVSMGGSLPEDKFDRVVLIDRGDDRSIQMLRELLEYRERHPSCDLMVLSQIDSDWTPAEVLARMVGFRGKSSIQLAEGRIAEVLAPSPQMEVRVSADRVLFEYAA